MYRNSILLDRIFILQQSCQIKAHFNSFRKTLTVPQVLFLQGVVLIGDMDKMSDMDPSDTIKRIDSVIFELHQIKKRLTESAAIPPPSTMDLVSSHICLNCKKKITSHQKEVRGCHEHCYRRIIRSIEDNQLTENEAITAGILAPKRKSGRKRSGNTGLDELIAEKQQAYITESAKVEKKSESKKKTRKKSGN